MGIDVRLATLDDHALLLGADVFDAPVIPELLNEVLTDPRLHLVLALEGAHCIGFLSAIHYPHPDKARQMWINELGVNETHRRQGIATRLVGVIMDRARALNCNQLWVIADTTDEAHGFYASLNAQRDGDDFAMFTIALDEATDG